MPNEPMMTAPRAVHAGFVAGAGLLGAGAAYATALVMGGDTRAISLAPIVVAISALAALLPDFLSGRVPVARWGMLAFAGTVVQPMVIMGLGLFFDKTRQLAAEPYWIACLVGGLLVLVAQVSAALFVLSRATARHGASTSVTPQTPSSKAV